MQNSEQTANFSKIFLFLHSLARMTSHISPTMYSMRRAPHLQQLVNRIYKGKKSFSTCTSLWCLSIFLFSRYTHKLLIFAHRKQRWKKICVNSNMHKAPNNKQIENAKKAPSLETALRSILLCVLCAFTFCVYTLIHAYTFFPLALVLLFLVDILLCIQPAHIYVICMLTAATHNGIISSQNEHLFRMYVLSCLSQNHHRLLCLFCCRYG